MVQNIEELIKANKCVVCGIENDSGTHVCQQCWREDNQMASEANEEAETIAKEMVVVE